MQATNRTPTEVEHALALLHQTGWAQPRLVLPTGERGAPKSPTWLFNPAVRRPSGAKSEYVQADEVNLHPLRPTWTRCGDTFPPAGNASECNECWTIEHAANAA